MTFGERRGQYSRHRKAESWLSGKWPWCRWRHCQWTSRRPPYAQNQVMLFVHAAIDPDADITCGEELGAESTDGRSVYGQAKRINLIRSNQIRIANRVCLCKVVFTSL